MEEFIVFVLGLILGSFANVVILRLNTGRSVVSEPSKCMSCNHSLSWHEMLPVVSYFALRGKCLSCGAKISLQYPAVEFVSGMLFLVIFKAGTAVGSSTHSGVGVFDFKTVELFLTALFFWLLLVISVYDIRHKIIPNRLVYSAAAVSLFVLAVKSLDLFSVPEMIIKNLSAGAVLFFFFASLWFFSGGRWMGFGDAKMALASGIFLGWPLSLTALLFSFWIGAVYGLVLITLQKAGSLKTQIPFGPFIFLGSLLAFLWGEEIILWYLSLI